MSDEPNAFERNEGKLNPAFGMLTLEDLIIAQSHFQSHPDGVSMSQLEHLTDITVEISTRVMLYQMDNEGWKGTVKEWLDAYYPNSEKGRQYVGQSSGRGQQPPQKGHHE